MKISVIIPCYNGEEFIGQTLGSLFDQTRRADEIIVVDDGSEDRSAEIAQSFGEPVTVLTKGGGGAANARNCGADHATGDAIMFLDADDVLGPNVLEHLIDQLNKNPDGVVACPWFHLMKKGDKWVKQPPSCKSLGKNQDHLSGWLTGWFHLPCTILWSRNAYKNRGGWDPRAYVNDDGDLMMRALADGVSLQITEKGASFYRRMPDEQLTESLSGARFTRKGREAQIYVVHKIAQMLEDRGKLNKYQKPITDALKQYRNLCSPNYPDLSEHCSELIVQFGDPRYVQIARNIGRSGQKKVHSVRRMLGLMKKRVLSKMRGNNGTAQNRNKENYTEIRYGLDTYQNVKKADKKGEIKTPKNPVLSVILPVTDDDAGALERSLQSVLNQEFDNVEVIIIGTEHSKISNSIAEKYDDKRLRFIKGEKNGDINSLRNLGLKEVKGDFVAFLNPQDEWFSDKLSKQLELFKLGSESIGLVHSGVKNISGEKESSVNIPENRGDVYRDLLLKNVIGNCSSVMIRRTVIPCAGFFDTSLSEMAEHDYWLRIARYYEFDIVEEPLLRSNVSPGVNQAHSTKNIKNEIEEKFFSKHHREFKREGIDRKIFYK